MREWIRGVVAGLNRHALSTAIYSGQILQFESLPDIAAAVRETRKLLCNVFAPHFPPIAHEFMTSEEHATRFNAAQQAFNETAAIKEHIYSAICAAGAHRPDTFCDRLRLRASPPTRLSADRPYYRSATPAHRDSWGSAILSQINWWFPIYPLQPEHTLAIFPAHWSKAIQNNTNGWDWRQVGKCPRTPRLPTALGPIDRIEEVRLLMPPGVLAAFSAAHLHAGVRNTTDSTRFSIETRSIDVEDLKAGRGAPNVDGLGMRPAFSWFTRMTDNRSLDECISAWV